MGWLETMPLIAVLLMIAIAAAGGFWAAVVARRKKSRARGPFLLGVFCGLMAGVALTGRRRGLNALGASTLNAVIRSLRAGIGLPADGVVARALTVAVSLVRLGPASSLYGFRKFCLTIGSRISRITTRGAIDCARATSGWLMATVDHWVVGAGFAGGQERRAPEAPHHRTSWRSITP